MKTFFYVKMKQELYKIQFYLKRPYQIKELVTQA